MSIQPSRPLLETLRDTLRKLEADPTPETENLADLKRILRERIAALEGSPRSDSPRPVNYESAAQGVNRQ